MPLFRMPDHNTEPCERLDLLRLHSFNERGESANVAKEHDRRSPHAPNFYFAFLGRDLFGDLRREVSLEVGQHDCFTLHACDELAVVNGNGCDAGKRDQELEIFVAEGLGRGLAIDVDDAEHSAFLASLLVTTREQRCAHGAADTLYEN